MKKAAIMVTLLIIASVAGGMNRSIIDREDLSLKAGPTEPGEEVSMVWLESYVYPKRVKEDRIISLGVRTTSSIESVRASFDFGKDKIALTSNDGMYWSGAYEIPANVVAGLHVARYVITGNQGSVKRTVEFFIEEPIDLAGKEQKIARGEAVYVQSWPLTVTTTCSALVGGSSRILFAGQKLIGISKVPWYKVIFENGDEGWVSAAMVREPLEEYYLTGYEAYTNKNYAAAVEYYQSTISIDPNFVKGHFWLAKSYYRKGDIDASYRSIMEALRLDDRNIDSRVFASKLAQDYFEIARAKLRDQRYNEAVQAYQKVLELKPNSTLSWLDLGKCYVKLGLPLEARSAWREALKIEPENREIHALLNIGVPSVRVAKALKKKSPKDILSPVKAMLKPASELPPVLADDSLEIVRAGKTRKGTRIESALKSVVSLTKSLGTPVVEKGWQTKKQGDKLLVRYLCEQGSGVLESFEWLVDVDTKGITASNDNSRLLMNRW